MEKSILAYFHSPEEAEGVAKQLQKLNPIDVSVDSFSKYPGDGVERITNPITGDIPSLAHLTLGADIRSRDAGILESADVSASGMSDGGQGGPTGRNILLTAVVNEEVFDEALQVVKDAGGLV